MMLNELSLKIKNQYFDHNNLTSKTNDLLIGQFYPKIKSKISKLVEWSILKLSLIDSFVIEMLDPSDSNIVQMRLKSLSLLMHNEQMENKYRAEVMTSSLKNLRICLVCGMMFYILILIVRGILMEQIEIIITCLLFLSLCLCYLIMTFLKMFEKSYFEYG